MSEDRRITSDEAQAARNILEKYKDQEAAERVERYAWRRKWLADMAGDFADQPELQAWAEEKRLHDLAKGVGGKSAPDLARAWNLNRLRDAVADVCHAFDLLPEAIMNRRPAPDLRAALEETK